MRRRIRLTTTWWPNSQQFGLGVYLWRGRTGIQVEIMFAIWHFSAEWTYRT